MDVKPELNDDLLVHFGVKGMKWGVRKDDGSSGHRLQTGGPKIEASLHQSNQTGAREVASLVNKRYGFEITEIKDLKVHNKAEYDYGTVGYVESTPGKRGGTIYMKPEDNRKDLKGAEDVGWFAPGTGNVRAFVTHESAHAMFHAEQSMKTGFFGPKVVGGNIAARDAALKAATKEAKREGIPPHETIGRVSGYAKASGSREELEAELFSQYHWSPNPPSFVKVWGQTLHQEMGIDSTPFREEANRG